MGEMKTTGTPMLLAGDSRTAQRLASHQQAAASLDNSNGGGCSLSLIQQRLHSSRAGVLYREFGSAVSRLGLADLFARGGISIAAVAPPAMPASATPISALGSLLSAERFSQPLPRSQQSPLFARYCRSAANWHYCFKVRYSQTHIHTTERKQ